MQTYSGGCHCGLVRFDVSMELGQVVECNCSYCQKHGLLLAFAPSEAVSILSGEDALQEYRFNEKKIQHLFCTTCGVQSFSKGTSPEGGETVAVNVRSLDDIGLSSLTRIPFDGKSR